MRDWVLAIALAMGGAALITWLAMFLFNPRWALRLGLCSLVGALLGFNYLALDLPGSGELMTRLAPSAALIITLCGAALGTAAGWVWRWSMLRKQKPVLGLPTPNRSLKPPADPASPPGEN
jgi:hypothetical protein